MSLLSTRKLAALVLLLSVWLGARQEVQADPITTMDGIAGSFTLAPDGSGSFTLSVTEAFITKHNGVSLGVPNWLPTTFSNLSVNPNPVSTSGGGTTYEFSVTSYPGGKTINPTMAQGGGQASFDLTFGTLFVPNASTNTAIVNGNDLLTSNTTGFDYSPFFNGGLTTITLNANPASVNFNDVFSQGGRTGGSASFSQAANPAVVPEPASLALWGVMGVAGMWYTRRKLKRQPTA